MTIKLTPLVGLMLILGLSATGADKPKPKKDCGSKNAKTCNDLGAMVASGDAKKLFKIACDGGNLKGCSNLAVAETTEGNTENAKKLVVVKVRAPKMPAKIYRR